MNPKSIALTTGKGKLPMLKVQTPWSAAEIYLLGAHVTHFQKNGEPPLLFLSRQSGFAPGKPIRGGVPICFPWFGPREGEPAHGFARIAEWQLVKTTSAPDGTVTLAFALPQIPGSEAWKHLHAEFVVTVADRLTMDLAATNDSQGRTVEIENCLHTYFRVGDISSVSLHGLQNAPFDDFAAGANGARRSGDAAALRITQETNRVYPDHAAAVEIRDEYLKRTIRVEKSSSKSTVVWNPWTTQKLPDDFDPAEYRQMLCVESGNVKANKIALGPGKAASLRVVISSRAG